MSHQNNYKDFIEVVGEELKRCALEAKANKENSRGTNREDFDTGYLCGFHRVITLMQQHAELYDIELSEISLDDINDIDLI